MFWLLTGMILRGWALAAGDQVEDGIAQMRQGLTGYQATGAGILRPYYLALLADVYGVTGDEQKRFACWTRRKRRFKIAASVGGRRSSIVSRENSRSGNDIAGTPEFDRERAAKDYFDKALRVASSQGAKSLELRAAMSLSRLWKRQGKAEEARQVLSEVYGWFTEGFETADLREAQKLIAEQ